MSLKQMLAAKLAELEAIKADEDGNYTAEQADSIDALAAEIKSLKEQIEKSVKAKSLVDSLKGEPADEPKAPEAEKATTGLTIGERFVKSAGYTAFKENHPSGIGSGTPIRIEAKGVGGINDLLGKATITTGTGQIPTTREPGYRNYLTPDEPLTFLDLVTTGTTDSPYSEYAQIVSETDNAAVVAEGALKPLSDLATALKESKAFTYADGFDITNQTLQDDGALAAFMESRIRRHVLGVVERKLLNGTGAGTEPEGIMNTTGTLSQAFDTDVVTTLAKAFAAFEAANGDAEPQAIVMNPVDMWALRLLKDGQGRYLIGNPFEQAATPAPWGVPIVRSRKLASGTALVGRFDSVHFLQLEALNVLAFNQHKDYAQKNMTYVRAEMRGRQLFYSPREVVVAAIKA